MRYKQMPSMELRYGYLVVLTVLCVMSLVFPILSLALNQWLRLSTTDSGPERQVFDETTYDYGLSKVRACVNNNDKGLHMCIVLTPNEFIKSVEVIADVTDLNETTQKFFIGWKDFNYKIMDGLGRIQIPVIVGLVLELIGFLIVMTFWRRKWKRWVLARKYIGAFSWLIGSILLVVGTILGLNLIKHFSKQVQVLALLKNSIIDGDSRTYFEMDKAWCLLYAGLAGLYGIATSVLVLLAGCFKTRGITYQPLSSDENLELDNSAHRLLGSDKEENDSTRLYI